MFTFFSPSVNILLLTSSWRMRGAQVGLGEATSLCKIATMKIKSLLCCGAALCVLGLADNAWAQRKPVTLLLPAPAIGIAPVPAPGAPATADADVQITEVIPEIFAPEPRRFQLLSTQVTLNGKPTPVVLKIDTATGMVSWLQHSESTIFVNGKAQTVTGLHFIPIIEQAPPMRGQPAGISGSPIRENPSTGTTISPQSVESSPAPANRPRFVPSPR